MPRACRRSGRNAARVFVMQTSKPSVAVIGSGTMGAGISQAALYAGCEVVLYDVSTDMLERARERIAAGLTRQQRPEALDGLRLATGLAGVTRAALVIEAVPEQLDLKRDLFIRLDFPLGPFALMDLIGIDVNFAVTSSVYE